MNELDLPALLLRFRFSFFVIESEERECLALKKRLFLLDFETCGAVEG